MNNNNIILIGLDTHKRHIEIAYALDGREQESVHFGRIPTTKQAIIKFIKQMQSKYPQTTLQFVYEAGPCGYWVYRLLTSLGHTCFVVAPSLIPRKPGERTKRKKKMR